MPAYFVTGTDTDAGKTFASCAMLTCARIKGLSTAALKPVAAGVIETPRGQCNEDVALLAECCSLPLSYGDINPVCFPEPIAPHIGAAKCGQTLRASEIAALCSPVLDRQADLTLVEGAGGWKVPLNQDETLADVARILELPVILVVGMRLGCLNHALLSVESIAASGLELAGWVANCIDPAMAAFNENIETLEQLIQPSLLGQIPWLEGDNIKSQAAGCLQIERLLQAEK